MSADAPTFTGLHRRRQTRRSVRIANALARFFITGAGLGTIFAVALICAFLVWVVVPLFTPGSLTLSHTIPLAHDRPDTPSHIESDEYRVLGYAVFDNARIEVFRLDTGEVLDRIDLFNGTVPSCADYALRNGHAIFAFEDGSVRLAQIAFRTEYAEIQDMDLAYADMQAGEVRDMGTGVVELTPMGQFRRQSLDATVNDPVAIADAPIRLADLSVLSTGPVFCTLSDDAVFHVSAVREKRNILTQQVQLIPSGGSIPIPDIVRRGMPDHLILEGRADSAYLIWNDGHTVRIDTRNRNQPVIAERLDLLEDPDAEITGTTTLIGKTTLVIADSQGTTATWFRVKPPAHLSTPAGALLVESRVLHPPVAERLRPAIASDMPQGIEEETDNYLVCDTSDASVLVRQHILPSGGSGSPVTALAPSKRNRMLAIAHADGTIDLVYVTADRLLKHIDAADAPITNLAMTPKNDGLLVASRDGYALWDLHIPHPETTLAAIFAPVWYEGAAAPAHVWQSSAGDDAFEPKFGLVPLIFGTLKATFYTMIIAVPLAILAAIYTSEFLHPKTKRKIKPTIEIMASLPSVVLGFLAALVFAPFVEDVVPFILLAFFTVPFTVLCAAFVWQLLPASLVRRLDTFRFLFALLAVPLGVLIAWGLAPLFESVLFASDIRAWLAFDPTTPGAADSPFASATPGWIVLLLPLSALAVAGALSAFVNPRIRTRTNAMDRTPAALIHLVKFLIATGATILLAIALAVVLTRVLALDPRNLGSLPGAIDLSPMGTYIQRNALIVGFVMGFAVIPIIYTIAEDALSAVPGHLRAASLGAGATRWQTAVRIIIPTAMSGIFSACMIGLGRAVGETMIVLMTAGNTPILDLNMFSGFRTLSANIAVELPEAVAGGTNYRMLFLAALTLFVMTFLVNTAAEVVRQRFRKRAYQL